MRDYWARPTSLTRAPFISSIIQHSCAPTSNGLLRRANLAINKTRVKGSLKVAVVSAKSCSSVFVKQPQTRWNVALAMLHLIPIHVCKEYPGYNPCPWPAFHSTEGPLSYSILCPSPLPLLYVVA